MSEHNETLAEIVAEIRKDKIPYSAKVAKKLDKQTVGDRVLMEDAAQCLRDDEHYIKSLADRIEAAHKREVEKLNYVIQAQRSAFDAEQDRQRRAAPGNAAAMREALVKIREIVTADAPADEVEIANIAYLALAKPPRNCDRYNSGDPVKDTDDACAEWQGQCDAEDVPPSCKVESAFRQWLFATAKPETKGENDGSK